MRPPITLINYIEMILPFVREIFAELEQAPGFEGVRRHLSLGAGRRRVSGLTATARALYLPLMARAAKQTAIVITADNKAAEALEPLIKTGCGLTGAVDPERVVRFPAHDVLPFENLSPHPDVQQQRASALWKLATGAVDILIAPVESAAMRLFDPAYYAGLAVAIKRGEEVDLETLTAHLASVGYTRMDLVEMPGQFTRRGGILDVYSPEADRPVRIEFFGDEIETIRRFDPESQRSLSGIDAAQLLPLTETPVTEQLLAAVNGRLSQQRIEAEDEGHRNSLVWRRKRLSRLGTLFARRRRGALAAHVTQALRAFCRRAGHGTQPDRPLVEQGRAAPRTLRHRLAHRPRRHLPAPRGAQSRTRCAHGPRSRSTGRGRCT
jgi:transcription-repair coupling factor (superfamily II helicase)